jgi:hypothetical protein
LLYQHFQLVKLGVAGCKVARQWQLVLSVWNVVPTLTSNERQGLSLYGRC